MCKLAFPDCQVLIHTTDWSEGRVGSWTQKTENEATDDPLLIHWIHLNLTGHLITRITPLLRLVLSSLPVIYGEQDLVFLKGDWALTFRNEFHTYIFGLKKEEETQRRNLCLVRSRPVGPGPTNCSGHTTLYLSHDGFKLPSRPFLLCLLSSTFIIASLCAPGFSALESP